LSVGFIKYPTAVKKKFSFSDKQLAVYEGEVPIKVLLKADATAAKGLHQLAAKLNVQACDDQLCYPPGTLKLTLPVTIK
ncbi:MAG: protein-disulfide reductase DsbD N-terminal domain-containing protein, partial [Acidobacteriota bacterium]|nr:protein-disulfide reductase DsbD N-terminal domain-containing protein [Acidobacteriota bacterium]